MAEGSKACNTCRGVKPFSDFYRHNNRRSEQYANSSAGYRHLCKDCHNAQVRACYDRQRGRYSRQRRVYHERIGKWRKYGLTRESAEQLFNDQGHACAICRSKVATVFDLGVDHCHDTGTTRGLLCAGCNNGIGFLRDDPDLLRAAIGYLERARKAASQHVA